MNQKAQRVYREVALNLICEADSKASKMTPGKGRTTQAIEDVKLAIGSLNRKVNLVEMVEPINGEIEKKKWLTEAKKGNFTNPDFQYKTNILMSVAALEPRADELLARLKKTMVRGKKAKFDKEMLGSVGLDLLLTCRMAQAMLRKDDDELAYLMQFKFDNYVPDDVDLPKRTERRAEAATELATEPKDYDARKISEVFLYALKKYGFDWPVIISDTATAVDVRDRSARGHGIVIPMNAKRTRSNVLRLVGHEIESHARISTNGSELFGYGGLDMKTDDETLYEGIAMLSDEEYDIWDHGHYEGPLPWYAIATRLALSGKSFAEIAKEIYEMRKDEPNALSKAYNVTQRVLRGVSNTANPDGYAFPKDLAYYNGYHIAKELKKSGYAWLLELGSFSYDDLMCVLQNYHVTPDMIPHKRIDLKNELMRSNM